MAELFRQFSFPGGVPSHVAPETPGSIHEGGELGYSLAHAFGAAFDNPGLVVACVVGDGEAETGPLATGWHGHRFLNPARDGAVLPILHLNGYKIANPALLARIPGSELDALLRGYGYQPVYVTGDEPSVMHQQMAVAVDGALAAITAIGERARAGGGGERPRWPLIVLRTPKGWTGPAEVDGLPVAGTWRSHQVPLAEVRTNRAHLRQLSDWLLSYRPAELFDGQGRPGRNCWPTFRTVTCGWAPARTRTGACCCGIWRCRTSGTTPSMCPSPAPACPSQPGCSAACCAT